VSMGLGPLMAIYQAWFMKYLHGRGIQETAGRKVWAFLGDGETDEPESLGSVSLAGREHLDNLIFVVNCNLQRLDGPVRGNGKIIQELETVFAGAGWNVIKVIWGGRWDSLLAADHTGILRRRMEECVDGEYQTFKSRDGAYVREHFFGAYPELRDRARSARYDLHPYLELEAFGQALLASDLVVARSGGSVFEIALYGRPAVLIPYPHASADHQTTNARWMADAGAAVVLADVALTGPRLARTVAELLGDRARLAAMGRASAALARPDAASAVARELLAAAARGG